MRQIDALESRRLYASHQRTELLSLRLFYSPTFDFYGSLYTASPHVASTEAIFSAIVQLFASTARTSDTYPTEVAPVHWGTFRSYRGSLRDGKLVNDILCALGHPLALMLLAHMAATEHSSPKADQNINLA